MAHNAISGFDDESTLREIVKLMDNVDDMMESYIGKEILEEPLEQFDKLRILRRFSLISRPLRLRFFRTRLETWMH